MEASATRHDRTADVVEPAVEDEVAKRPRRHFVIGNTYSLLDTKRLIEFGEEAEGRAHLKA
jgi:hypothetical protein